MWAWENTTVVVTYHHRVSHQEDRRDPQRKRETMQFYKDICVCDCIKKMCSREMLSRMNLADCKELDRPLRHPNAPIRQYHKIASEYFLSLSLSTNVCVRAFLGHEQMSQSVFVLVVRIYISRPFFSFSFVFHRPKWWSKCFAFGIISKQE